MSSLSMKTDEKKNWVIKNVSGHFLQSIFRLEDFPLGTFGLVLLSLTFLFSLTAQSKDLTSRLGIGGKYSSAVENLPQLAAVYYPVADLGVTGGLGVDTQDQSSRFAFDIGLRKIIFKEPNMNFYVGGRVGLINYEEVGTKNSGYEMAALFGGEFFLPGLDSLGFSFDTGVGIVSTSKVRFKSFADNPMRAALIFYF